MKGSVGHRLKKLNWPSRQKLEICVDFALFFLARVVNSQLQFERDRRLQAAVGGGLVPPRPGPGLARGRVQRRPGLLGQDLAGGAVGPGADGGRGADALQVPVQHPSGRIQHHVPVANFPRVLILGVSVVVQKIHFLAYLFVQALA